MPQYFQTFIFDLDGTLLNTLADLAGACNSLLTAHGWPEHPVDAYRLMVGNGFRLLVSRCLPSSVRENLTDEDLSALVDEGKRNYCARLTESTRPYPGMSETIRELGNRGCLLGVISNKPDAQTRLLVEHFFPGAFACVHGHRQGIPLKPDPAPVFSLMTEMQATAGSSVYVGDSSVDMITASRAGLPSVGCAWGFRGEEELRSSGAWKIISEPDELVSMAETPLHTA